MPSTKNTVSLQEYIIFRNVSSRVNEYPFRVICPHTLKNEGMFVTVRVNASITLERLLFSCI